MSDLKKRVDPQTGLVAPRTFDMARKFGVSRSTICRRLAELRRDGRFELVRVPVEPNENPIYYRLRD